MNVDKLSDIWSKYFGLPDESREDFFARHGIVELEYLDHMDLVRERLSSIGLTHLKEYEFDELIDARFPPFGIYNVGNKIDITTLYRLNSDGLRSDEFTTEHDGLHILFAGCSNTAGDSYYEEMTWPRITHRLIAEEQKTSGYFNVAACGASISEIIRQVNLYIEKYGNPNVIFINLPNIERESENNVELRESVKFIYTQYSLLEKYCKTNDIFLVSFSWNEVLTSRQEFVKDDIKNPLRDFDTFYPYDIDGDRMRYMHNYITDNKDRVPESEMLVALDGVHPGAAENDFYGHFAYNIFKGGYNGHS